MMKQLLLVILAVVMPMVTSVYGGVQEKVMPVVIDVRDAGEWQAGHLEGAAFIPYNQIERQIGGVTGDKQGKIYLYCRSGRRSALALESLKSAGYLDVENLGSMESAATALGRPIVK